MKAAALLAGLAGVVLVAQAAPPAPAPSTTLPAYAALSAPSAPAPIGVPVPVVPASVPTPSPSPTLDDVVATYCARCHSDRMMRGNLSLESFEVGAAASNAAVAEKMVRKLRAGMMPPPGQRRPGGDTLATLARTLEETIDADAVPNTNPGNRTFQRLNRAEYAASVKDLLDLEIDAGDYLPLDTKSANFDNIADVQMLSPTTMATYMNAAAEVARLAVGDPDAAPVATTYTNSGYATQWERVEGAPRGTRGGMSVVHTFPADGDFVFTMAFEHTTTGGFYGRVARGEEIEVSVDGGPVALLAVDRWMDVSDPNGVHMETEPVFVTAGPHRVTAAFVKQWEGPPEDLVSPHEWSLADRQIGVSGYGVTALAHLKDLVVEGPFDPAGVSDTPSRARVFSCDPDDPADPEQGRICAAEIVERLAPRAFRRPLTDADRAALLSFYEQGAERGRAAVQAAASARGVEGPGRTRAGFEAGIRTMLQAILASPDFVFRFEELPPDAEPGRIYRISDPDLATRMAFFLWGAPPDDELMEVALEGRLSDADALDGQVRRMLSDPRSEALATRFAAQWLRLDDLDKVHPDRLLFPDYHQQLADAMRRETELFFHSLVAEDRSLLDLYTADYTFVNEDLARHYGIRGVSGDSFRRVTYPDDRRRGLFGHGSILTLTSHANRTSPVLRGKWVMEVLMGTPPPPPPPGVPDLEETEETEDGRVLTTRERMEMHRESPACRSCHTFMDPIGLALDNFDVTGRWRIKEHGLPLDTRGEMYDGTPVESPADLREALLRRPTPLLRTFTENLMAYALGRRVEYFDQPAIRTIVADAAEEGYRMSAFILGVVASEAFRTRKVEAAAPDEGEGTGEGTGESDSRREIP